MLGRLFKPTDNQPGRHLTAFRMSLKPIFRSSAITASAVNSVRTARAALPASIASATSTFFDRRWPWEYAVFSL